MHWFVTLSLGFSLAACAATAADVTSSCVEDEVSLLQTRAEATSRMQPERRSMAKVFGEFMASESSESYPAWRHCSPTVCNKCTSYPNVLRLGGRGRAGLDDRLVDLITFTSLAETMCARVHLRPPCEKLLKYQTGEMDREVPWSKYIELIGADGSDMMQEPDFHEDRIVLNNTGPADETLGQIQNTTVNGKAFDLTIDYDFLSVPWKKFHPPGFITLGCLYHAYNCKNFKMQASKEVSLAAKQVRDKLGVNPREYVALHVRRMDAHDSCNTTIDRVVDYVTCSLSHPVSDTMDLMELNKKSDMSKHPIIFFTDEKDTKYTEGLEKKLTEAFSGTRKVFHGERIMRDVLKEQVSDGLKGGVSFEYMTSLLLRYEAGVEMLMDRSHCQDCDTKPKATILCPIEMGHRCDFTQYLVIPQFDTSKKAVEVSGQVNIKNDPSSACSQQTFPELDNVASDMVGFVVKDGEEDPYGLPTSGMKGIQYPGKV